MKKLFFINFLLVGTLSFGQISFEDGYFIDNSHDSTSCYIKNVDWLNNPTSFKYKLIGSDEEITASISDVREFGISNSSKYIRFKVDIDRSTEDITNLESSRNPVFNQEILFLKVIVGGQISLYSYTEKNLQRFFFKTSQTKIEQLVFKSFIYNGNVRQNNLYKQQLLTNLKCESISSGYIESMAYSKNDLAKYFIKYYQCKSFDYTLYEVSKKELFHLRLRPGVNFSSLILDNQNHYSADVSFSNNLGYRVGVEVELVMPFNKYKWAVTFEPTYKNIQSDTQKDGQSIIMNYSSLELPIGLRHYFFLNTNLKILANAVFTPVIPFDAKLEWENGPELQISKTYYFGLGVGVEYKNRFSLESRYSLSHDILGSYIFLSSDYSDLSIIVGYSIF